MNKRLIIPHKTITLIREDFHSAKEISEIGNLSQLDVLRFRSGRRYRRGKRKEIVWAR